MVNDYSVYDSPTWAYWSWPMRGYTPILAYILYCRSIHEGLRMWMAYLNFAQRVDRNNPLESPFRRLLPW